MKITRFEPWSYVDLIHRDLQRKNRSDPATAAADWAPAVDIIEEKERFVLRADVPGVSPEDIELSMDGAVLTVAGVRHAQEHGEDTKLQRAERSSGRFSRRFTLPETTDASKIAAKIGNGLLEVSIPKLAQVQPRRITVEAA